MEVDPVLIYRYTIWANDRVMEGARQLTPQQLAEPIRPGFVSMLGLLVHMMAAERNWLLRWRGTSPRRLLSVEDIPSLDALQAAWEDLRAEMLDYLSRVEGTDQVVVYQTTAGDEHQTVLWHLIYHVFNHATEHRAQGALYLAMHGIDVGGLDFSKYVREILPAG